MIFIEQIIRSDYFIDQLYHGEERNFDFISAKPSGNTLPFRLDLSPSLQITGLGENLSVIVHSIF